MEFTVGDRIRADVGFLGAYWMGEMVGIRERVVDIRVNDGPLLTFDLTDLPSDITIERA